MQKLDTDGIKLDASQLEEISSDSDGNPKFGRLLVLLAVAVAFIVILTFASQAYYTT